MLCVCECSEMHWSVCCVCFLGFRVLGFGQFCKCYEILLCLLLMLCDFFDFVGGKKKEVKKETGLGLVNRKDENFGEWYSEVCFVVVKSLPTTMYDVCRFEKLRAFVINFIFISGSCRLLWMQNWLSIMIFPAVIFWGHGQWRSGRKCKWVWIPSWIRGCCSLVSFHK